jgi:hypothetical protein
LVRSAATQLPLAPVPSTAIFLFIVEILKHDLAPETYRVTMPQAPISSQTVGFPASVWRS